MHVGKTDKMSRHHWLSSSAASCSSDESIPLFLPQGDPGTATAAANQMVVKALDSKRNRKRENTNKIQGSFVRRLLSMHAKTGT